MLFNNAKGGFMTEEWRDIPGYEGLYQVSNLGEVKSLPKEYIVGNGAKRNHGGMVLKPGKNDHGYLAVALCKEGTRRNFRIHKLVARIFLGESILEVNHINGIKTDNYLENLEYCTRSENIKHAFDSGLALGLKGEKNPSSKLNNDIIKNIRENKYCLTVKEFSICYNIHITTIYKILKNKYL